MDSVQYRIGELAEKAGVTRRTVHYYMARGLLPPSQGTGLGTTYSDDHLYRIMLIKKLQDQYLPLDQIRIRITDMSLEQVKTSLESEPVIVSEPIIPYSVEKITWMDYKRIPVGFGVEIHFPSKDEKAAEFAEKLNQYAQKMMKEG